MSTPLTAVAPGMTDLTPVLLLVACGFIALFLLLRRPESAPPPHPHPQPLPPQQPPPWFIMPPHMQQHMMPQHTQPSPEIRAIQETLKMLAEQQTALAHAQKQPPQQPSSAASSSKYASAAAAPPSPTAFSSSESPSAPLELLLQDLTSLQDKIKNLERRNRELNRQLTLTEVSNVVDIERKYRLPLPVGGGEAAGGGGHGGAMQQVNLSAADVETIRAIFNTFDSAQTGAISTGELRALHKQLGEPLTDEEASAAVNELDPEGTGTVIFNKFLIWWAHQHNDAKKGSAYTQRFKLMHARLTAEFNVDKVVTQDSGEIYTLEYRLNFYYKSNAQSLKPISPWHDIPLNRVGAGEQGQLFNFVCEIPKWTRAKFECATGELYNPIKQDTQHGKLRYYKHGDMMFNYGFLPQTWEDPDVIPPDTQCPGDNDPIDCVEIGATQLRVGSISGVKVLGLLGLIDDGETDWKIIACSIADPMAHLLNDIDDVELHLPGAIKAIREYFRDYKSTSGKINTYALRGQAMPKHYAIKIIEETHQHWKSLHLVKKRNTIGETSVQAELRAATASSPSASAASVPVPSPDAPGLIRAASSVSPAAVAAATASPRVGPSRPLTSLTGMEQPLDKLMTGK